MRIAAVFEGNELTFWTQEMLLDFKPTTVFDPFKDSICDVRNDNRESVDLTSYENEILNGKTGIFTYIDDRDNEISNPTNYLFVGPMKEIQVIIQTPDECENKTTITLTFDAPIPASSTTLSLCDFNNDREENFDLNESLTTINPNFLDFTVSYYLTQNQANTGDIIDAISNPDSYLLNRGFRRIYVRLQDIDGCYTTTFVDLRIITVPQFINTIIEVCDFKNDSIEENTVLDTYNFSLTGRTSGVAVEYYTTEQNAIDSLNAITTSNITPSTTLYVNLRSGVNCVQRSPITFNFTPTPEVKNVAIDVCDNEKDGTELYDLTSQESTIVTVPADKTITYYNTEEDASLLRNRILTPAFYTLNTTPKTIFVRVEEDITNCYSIAEIALKFIFPTEVNNTRMKTCDIGADGSEIFDVTTVLTEMLPNPNDFEVSYYTRRDAAASGDTSFEIPDPTKTDTAITSIVYVRFYDDTTGCYSIGEIFLELQKTPKLLRGGFEICDTDFDTFFTLDLADINTQMIQNTTDLVFSYFTSFNDANTNNNSINNPQLYTVPSFPHRVYARVESDNGCFSVSFVDMKIREQVSVNTITEIIESCDNDRDDFAIFNLTTLRSPITNEVSPSLKYYDSLENANTETNEISDPTNYQNKTPIEQDIFVRVSAPDKCDNITSFKIKIIKITPNINTDVPYCDGEMATLDAGPGFASYLWNTGQTSQTIEVTEGNYTVEIENNKGCKNTFEIIARKNLLPEVSNDIIKLCDDDLVDGKTRFNLNEAIPNITNGATGVSVLFFDTIQNLENSTNELSSNSYVNTQNPQTVFAKVINTSTLCYSPAELTLEVSSITPNPASIELCDLLNSEDGITEFDLSTATPQILNGLVATPVTYFKTREEAKQGIYPLDNLYTNTTPNTQNIFSRIENSDGCIGIGTVSLIVNSLPDINVEESLSYCLDTFPNTINLSSGIARNQVSDFTYNWNTGATTASIDVNESGTYSVEVTSSKGCKKTKIIQVEPSEIATIDSIEIEDKLRINSITVFVSGRGDYEFSLDNFSFQDNSVFNDISPDLYTVYVRDKKGDCGVVNESISVLGFPKFFTPNDDGDNDTWVLKGFSPEFQQDMEIFIFDRYGSLLAKMNPLDRDGWDGSLNGKPLPATDYWYNINYKESFSGKIRKFSGHFSLIR